MSMSELELRLFPSRTGDYTLDLLLRQAGSAGFNTLAQQIVVTLDETALRATWPTTEAYGRLLAQQIFATAEARRGWRDARQRAQGSGEPLRVRLVLRADDALTNRLRWETLRDPDSDTPVMADGSLRFSRTPASENLAPITLRPRAQLRLLIAAADPLNASKLGLASFDAPALARRLGGAVGDMATTCLVRDQGQAGPGLDGLIAALADTDLVFLAAHGAQRADGELAVFLEDATGQGRAVTVAELAQRVGLLARRPLLIFLASCGSAGRGYDDEALRALGSRLTAVGIPAVIAMQGDVAIETAEQVAAAFFKELHGSGQVEDALAAARTQVLGQRDWWMPVLYSRLTDGVIWADDRPARQRLQMAPPPPEDFVARPAELEQIVAALLVAEESEHVAISAALRGAGGYGKTVLARAACHDPRVDEAFPDGALWVTLGEVPGDLAAKLADLIETLSGERPGFATVEAAASKFAEALGARRCLLVIDDVWNAAHLNPFLRGGPRCVRLITTRNSDTLPPQAREIAVDAMRAAEALALIGSGVDQAEAQQEALGQLAARLGEWPLLLRLTNGALRDRIVRQQQSLANALAYMNTALDRRGLIAFDVRNAVERTQAVSSTLSVSLDLLRDNERERYAELAIFPEDVDIPLAILEQLWGATGGLDDFEVEEICGLLGRLSLLLSFDLARRTVRLHDVVRAHLTYQHQAQLPAWHAALLDASHPTTGSWADLPDDELYMWQHLAAHLVGAGRGAELVALVKDLRYLARKAFLRGPLAVEQDLLAAGQAAPDDTELPILIRSFVNASHLLAASEDEATCAATLYSRLCHVEPLRPLVEALAQVLPRPTLIPFALLPDLPHSRIVRTLTGHTDEVWGCALSADGRTIVSASIDYTVGVWDTTTGTLRATLTGHTAPVIGCAVSADGRTIVSASADETVRVWDATTGTLRTTLTGHTDGVAGCAVSADGCVIVSASFDETVRVWDATTGTLRATLTSHTAPVMGCALSADGRTIVSASDDRTVRVWDATTGTLRTTLTGHTADVAGCAVSADGRTIVSASWDSTVGIWDATTGTLRATLTGHTAPVMGCALSADGRTIVSASDDRTVRVWDATTGTLRTTFTGHTALVRGCAVSADGHTIVSASWDDTVRVWDATTGTLRTTLTGHTDKVKGCAVSADGCVIVSASSDKTVRMWDATTGTLRATLIGHTDGVKGCALSADGRTIVSASSDNTVRMWDATTGTLRTTLTGHTTVMNDCAVSADGRMIVSASGDKTVRVWDSTTATLRATLTGHTDMVMGCAVSADGRTIVSASADETVRVWDATTGTLRAILTGHTDWVWSCAVSADGRTIVSASSDKTVRVWDATTGTLRATLIGHTDGVMGCALSADGRTIVSASDDRTVRVWGAAGRQLAILHVDSALTSCACSADGSLVVAGGTGGGVYFLKLLR
ncbi:CHAT domain-containing protein [Chloroflexales bacterium ZM16-3]|nr:CHAT domain-containing protein [Chloroflexales bacterium ZM16-3]